MSSRNDRAWAGYDSWKLSTPDDDAPEVFESRFFKLFSCIEDDVDKFDDYIAKAMDNPSIYLDDDTSDLESLEDYKELLLGDDEYCWNEMHKDTWDAVEALRDLHHALKNDDWKDRRGE